MTSTELKEARARLQLTQEALARKLEVNRSAVAKWEAGLRRIPTSVELLIQIWSKQHVQTVKRMSNARAKGRLCP